MEDREEANRRSAESGFPLFIPVCREDGSYVEVRVFAFRDREHKLRDGRAKKRNHATLDPYCLGLRYH